MSNAILTKYRSINPLIDDATTDAMLKVLVEIPASAQQRFWIRSQAVGNVCIYTQDDHPGKVLEYVQGSQEDSVTTLYSANGVFNDLSTLEKVRSDLINEIGAVLMRLPSTIGVMDQGRGRQVALKELGTAQLIDTLAHFTSSNIAGL